CARSGYQYSSGFPRWDYFEFW
nr:immunoglobulin heavy chain junction region [Macaca mulatta]MOV40292.1 immunoglobulin heavy chain junction region [Macaca mulatta]MOV40952.1 immunoglobulin heavy chain junction region [Macaca mulatta]MOV42556.1 immunoglobulin heavy chain junction region [Macaca mulatta]MOV42611.1 immunoglobulin heavy chain junction region [Macaca mulatta]